MTFDDNTDREALAKVLYMQLDRTDFYDDDGLLILTTDVDRDPYLLPDYSPTGVVAQIADSVLAVLPSLGWVKADNWGCVTCLHVGSRHSPVGNSGLLAMRWCDLDGCPCTQFVAPNTTKEPTP